MSDKTIVSGFHHVAIKVKDFDASVKFYTQVLGLKPKISWGEGYGKGIMLDAGDGACVEIFAGGPNEPKPEGCWMHLAFRTSDCQGALERVRKSGMPITVELKDVAIPSQPATNIRIAFFKGPDGELVELFEHR